MPAEAPRTIPNVISDPTRAAAASPAERVGLWARPKAGVIWGGVWLVYLVPAFVEALDDRHELGTRIAGVLLLLTFGALYLAAMLSAWDRDDSRGGVPRNLWVGTPSPLGIRIGIALIVLSVASVLVVGEPGVSTFVFLAPVASSLLPGRWAVRGIAAAILAVVLGELFARNTGAPVDASAVLSSAFAALMAGLITLGVRRMRVVMWELQVARQDAGRLATAEERVRIARDLHDVLGHSLTVISVRGQLAARLAERGEMDRAAQEIKAVELLSRTAMSDVREAVAGYRSRPLAAELAAAEATLDGAGLGVHVERSVETVPESGEDTLAFVLREAVTNVLRHSQARNCRITVRGGRGTMILEVGDDGIGSGRDLLPVAVAGAAQATGAGAPTTADVTTGHRVGTGLVGLAERLAAVGGRLSAGDDTGGGFLVQAEVPR